MTDARRFLLLMLSGLLLFAGLTVVALERTDPAQAAEESPLLQAVATTTAPTTTVTEAPTTVPEAPATTLGTVPPNVEKKAVAPPRNPYAPEPIIEIGSMEIPKIGLRHKVMHGISLRNIDQGPSHWPGTALPGEAGNTVFAGHRTTNTKPFRRLDELRPGDEIIFNINGVRSVYLTTGTEIVTPNRLDIVNPTAEPTVTLFACHPPGSAKFRIVVRGVLAPSQTPPPAASEAPAEAAPPAPAEG